MALQFVLALAFFALASAGYVPVQQVYHSTAPLALTHKSLASTEDYDHHPKYSFAYGVEDKVTGDIKSQTEERDGDVVHGQYSLIDADGYKRTVTYTSDPHNGFQAEVQREPLQHDVKTVAAAPVAHYAAPTLIKTVEPIHHYAAPTVVKTYTAPTHYAPSVHYTHDASPSYIYHH